MAHFHRTAAFTRFNTPSRIEADIVDLAHEGTIPGNSRVRSSGCNPIPSFRRASAMTSPSMAMA